MKHSILKSLEKLSLKLTDYVGSIWFFLFIFTWTFGWLSWNMFAPKNLHFDPYPGFVLWLFLSNMIQILLMPLIMLGQNIQSKKSEANHKRGHDTTKKELENIKKELSEIKQMLKK